MKDKKDFYEVVAEIYEKDGRYKPDAYEFIIQALHFTQKKLKKHTHVTGRELSEGLRDFAIEQFGPMAKTVLTRWGISKTQDYGNIVFYMIEKKLLSKTEEDSISDFNDVYDFESVFANVIRDSVIKGIEK